MGEPSEMTTLDHPHTRRVTTYDARSERAVGPPPSDDRVRQQGDDSTRLVVLLLLFTAAALIVVVALLGAAVIDTWWALVAVMVVHFAMTGASFAGVAFVFTGRVPAHRAGH